MGICRVSFLFYNPVNLKYFIIFVIIKSSITRNVVKMIRAIIIDDESNIRQLLSSFIEQECTDVDIIGEADSVASGISIIQETKPDLVFLDIRLPDGAGFDILTRIETIDFNIIFITAYDEYAVRAFEYSAIDYILKPFDPVLLKRAIKRATHIMKAELSLKMNTLLSNLDEKEDKKIVFNTSDHVYIIKVKDIICLESDQNYTTVNIDGNRKILISKTLKEYESMLGDYNFLRVHRSHLINPSYIEGYEKTEGGTIIMKNGHRIPVSSRRKDVVLEYFEKM